MRKPSGDYPWRFAIFLAVYYASNALYQGFLSVYLESVGLDTLKIGTMLAIVPVMTILSQPLWGSLADRSRNRTRVMCWMAVLAGAFALLHGASGEFVPLMLAVGAFAACYPAIQPLGDAIVLESLNARKQPFGPLRISASVAFALSSLASGWLFEGRMRWFPVFSCAILALTALSTVTLPQSPGRPVEGREANMLMVLKIPRMKGLIALFMVGQLTLGYFYAFFPLYFTALPGGSKTLLGLSYLISSLSEIPFLLFSDRLFRRLGAGRLLLLASLVMGARWLLLSASPSVGIVMASQLLHGGGFIVLTVTMAMFIARAVPESLRARGQMLLSVCGYGLSRVAGNLLGGLIGSAAGLHVGFLAAAAVCALTLFAVPAYFKHPPLTGETPSGAIR